jgi:DNA-binding response OmpR family regulator
VSDAPRRTILIATDADELFDEVDAALSDGVTTLARVRAGQDVLDAVKELQPELILLDLQIGNMGGVATSLTLRNEESFGRIDEQRVVLLLDRSADVFLARRSGADGWLIKPLHTLRLRHAVDLVLADETYTEGVQAEVRTPEAPASATGGESDPPY